MSPQQHLERLSAVDASFLANESPTSHMHVGAVVRLEGPPPHFEEFLDGLRARLHLVPPYRQKLAPPPPRTPPPRPSTPAGRCGSTTRTSTSSTTCARPRCPARGPSSSSCA